MLYMFDYNIITISLPLLSWYHFLVDVWKKYEYSDLVDKWILKLNSVDIIEVDCEMRS